MALPAGTFPLCAPPRSPARDSSTVQCEREIENAHKRLTRTASQIPGLDHISRTTQIPGLGMIRRTAEMHTLSAITEARRYTLL